MKKTKFNVEKVTFELRRSEYHIDLYNGRGFFDSFTWVAEVVHSTNPNVWLPGRTYVLYITFCSEVDYTDYPLGKRVNHTLNSLITYVFQNCQCPHLCQKKHADHTLQLYQSADDLLNLKWVDVDDWWLKHQTIDLTAIGDCLHTGPPCSRNIVQMSLISDEFGDQLVDFLASVQRKHSHKILGDREDQLKTNENPDWWTSVEKRERAKPLWQL